MELMDLSLQLKNLDDIYISERRGFSVKLTITSSDVPPFRGHIDISHKGVWLDVWDGRDFAYLNHFEYGRFWHELFDNFELCK